MSSSQGKPSSSGGSGFRGDVSFIRATANSGFGGPAGPQNQHPGLETVSAPQQFSASQNHLHSSSSHSMQEISSHHLPSHHHQPSHRSHQQQQHSSYGQQLQYPPDHLDQPAFLGNDRPSMPPHPNVEPWTDKEEALATELEEAKIRVAQMEKTMRWWSDCTSNWREKWNKARNERNKAREENRVLRVKLDTMAKELTRLKREKKLNGGDKERQKDEEQVLKGSSSSNVNSQEKFSELSEKEKTVIARANEKESESLDDLSETSSPKSSQHVHGEKDIDDLETVQSGHGSLLDDDLGSKTDLMAEQMSHLQGELAEAHAKAAQLGESLVLMQRKLDEANNTIQVERLEICNKGKTIENLQTDLQDLRQQFDEKLKAKTALEKELADSTERHRDEVNRLSIDLEDETISRTTMDRHVSDLRRELERLQSENASEWGKRERLESEKLVLERDNKKLRAQVRDLEDELEKRSHTSSSIVDSDLKTLQFDLGERTKELLEMKHLHSKIKKAYAERGTELDHLKRRAEQYESEVRKLRARVDELKHDLCSAEDEVDNQSNAARKAQRTNDELQEQVDSLRVQVNHLQTRLRRSGNLSSTATPRSTSLKSLTLEDSADFADSENDFDDI